MATEAKIALHVLAAGLVLDRSVFIGQNVAEMHATIVALRGAPKKSFTIIENGATFFTAANMLELIKANDDGYKLIAEKAGVAVTEDSIRAIQIAEVTSALIKKAMIPPIPPYPFAKTPDGFTGIDQKFEICNGGKSLRRVNGHHTLGLVLAQLIWRYLSAAWAINKVAEDKYFREHRVCQRQGDLYRIGCQEINRYEIEQIALWQGWKFPEPATK